MLRSMSMSVSRWIAAAAFCAWSVVRIEVPGHRRTERDLRRLFVADLADQQHVGVGAQDRPQSVRERESGARVHLDLVEPFHAVLDGILDRRQLPVRGVEQPQAREQVVVLPEAVGPTTTTAPNGCSTARSSAAWLPGDMPRASRESGASPCDSIR